MTRTTKKAAAKLNTAIAGAVKRFAPPESLTVDEWADKHRRLSPESSAEAGPWRTKRTPYLEEPMRAFTDPKVHKIVMVAASAMRKKADVIAAIEATKAEQPDDGADDEEPPQIGAADPV